MNPPQKPRWPDRRYRFGPALLALLLQACAHAPPPTTASEPVSVRPSPVVGRDKDLVIVLAEGGDDLASLAERYLGNADKAWWIADFNGITRVEPGQEVVIPLRPRNTTGVTSQGFQTVPILCYHRFGGNRNKLVVGPSAFDAQMDYLARNGYQVIALPRLVAFLEGREPLPRKSVVITIDDGYRSTYDIAYPILKKHNFPATVFLYTDFVGSASALTWPQMQEMTNSGLIDVQPHSKTHSNLALRLPREIDTQYRERMRQEVETPSKALKDHLERHVYSYAYPYGDVNDAITEQLARQGIKLGLTVTPGGNGFFASPLMLRRTMVYGDDNLDTFKSKLAVFASKAGL